MDIKHCKMHQCFLQELRIDFHFWEILCHLNQTSAMLFWSISDSLFSGKSQSQLYVVEWWFFPIRNFPITLSVRNIDYHSKLFIWNLRKMCWVKNCTKSDILLMITPLVVGDNKRTTFKTRKSCCLLSKWSFINQRITTCKPLIYTCKPLLYQKN